MKEKHLHPAVEEIVSANNLDREKLAIKFLSPKERGSGGAREDIMLTDGTRELPWKVSSLRELFRGETQPPPFANEPPADYMPLFLFLEFHVSAICEVLGSKTDGEFEEVFNFMRRRPDGKSLNELHALLWQAAAGLAGIWPVSALEYEAIFARLTRSARTFRTGEVSRNYIMTLRQTFSRPSLN
jgi:hypothetical protein